MIVVFDADDIVFAKIAAGLYLDQLEVDLAGVFQTVPGAARHCELVFVTALFRFADAFGSSN